MNFLNMKIRRNFLLLLQCKEHVGGVDMNRVFLVFGLILVCGIVSLGQNKSNSKKGEIDQNVLKKELIINDLENQLKSVSFAAVRVCTRQRMAAWLWKDGKDLTGRAEDIATTAIDDYYKNKDEIAPLYSCAPQLFVLLDANAKEVAKRLREKYSVTLDESQLIPALLAQKDGEKKAVDAAIRLLSRPNEKGPDLVYLLLRLEQLGSPELPTLLAAVVAAEGAGRTTSATSMLEIFTGIIIGPNIPVEIQKQFIHLVLERSRNFGMLSESDRWSYYRTLERLWPDISTKYPELLGEAGTIRAVLRAQVGNSVREANERSERIANSADKLAATVSEAEHAEDKVTKFSLYKNAARIALNEKKFRYSIDLMAKAAEIELPDTGISDDFRKKEFDGFYWSVIGQSLKADDPEVAVYADGKMTRPLAAAEGLIEIFKYHIDKGNMDAGRTAHFDAIKLIEKAESSPEGVALLLRMIPTIQKMDPARVFDLSEMVARSINTIPSLNVEDKPDTKNYQDYVAKVMIINRDLRPAITDLMKENREVATTLANRIDKREIKIIANYVLLTEGFGIPADRRKEKESAQIQN